MKERGSVVFIAVFGFTVLLILGMGLAEIAYHELMISQSSIERVKAYYMAEAGIEKALYSIKEDPELIQYLKVNDIVTGGENPFDDINETPFKCSFSQVVLTGKEQTAEAVKAVFYVTGRCNKAVRNLKVRAYIYPDGRADIIGCKG